MRALLIIAAPLVALSVACASRTPAQTPTPQVLTGTPGATAPPQARTPSPSPAPTPTPAPVLVSLDWLDAGVGVPGLTGAIVPAVQDDNLKFIIEEALTSFDGNASVVVESLVASPSYAAVNESQSWYAASTFKAAILLTAYQQRDAGTLDFDKVVTLTEDYTQYDLGTLEYLGLKTGDLVTIRDAVRGMIVVSDTSLAALIEEEVGGNSVDAMLRSIGATVMTVNSRDLPTTALDLTRLMIAIAAGQGVSTESRDEMLSLMAQEWYTQGISAGLPPGTPVSHKSGSFGTAVHDAGIVFTPNGPYVIVVMTDGSAGWDPIAAVSAAVWHYYNSAF